MQSILPTTKLSLRQGLGPHRQLLRRVSSLGLLRRLRLLLSLLSNHRHSLWTSDHSRIILQQGTIFVNSIIDVEVVHNPWFDTGEAASELENAFN